MKKLIIISMLLLVGCSHNTVAPNTAATHPEPKPEVHQHDNFDTAGEYGAAGSRWVWNKTKDAYDWVTSEENQARYKRAWEATKEAVKSGYDTAQKTYEEHK